MHFTLLALATCVCLLIGMLLLLEAGRRIGLRRIARHPADALAGLGVVEGAVFALFGLLLAFSFSGAAARLDLRRQLLAEETTAIGTAWLRLELLPAQSQPALRELFRRYLDSRVATYRALPDLQAAEAEGRRSLSLQDQIWSQAVAAARDSGYPPAALLLLPSLNAMIDITTTRRMASRMHPPAVVFAMLAVLALVGALLAGHAMAQGPLRSGLHLLSFALLTAVTLYVIVDLEYPRLGLIRVDAADEFLVELRQGMD